MLNYEFSHKLSSVTLKLAVVSGVLQKDERNTNAATAVVLVNQGEESGRLAVIAEILDHNRAIIEGPTSGVKRQALAFRRMNLTPFTLQSLPRGAGPTVVKKHFEQAEIAKKWAASSWAKKLEAVQRRKQTSDFERFQIMLLKKQRRSVGNLNLVKAKKANKA